MEGPNKRVKVSDLASSNSVIVKTSWTQLYESILKPIESDEDAMEKIALECFSINLSLSPEDLVKLKGLIHATRLKYNDVMYHSFKHGLHVLVNCAKILYEHQKYIDDIDNTNNKFTQCQIYATIFAALIHDIEHLGVFNSTLTSNRHELAILYNDQSVAEMRSLNIGLNYLYDFDILNNLSENELKDFRKLVIDLVLSTDIVDPIRSLYYNNNTEKKSNTGSLMTILKLSDVGSSTQDKNSAFTWTQRFYHEQYAAHKNYNQSRNGIEKFYTYQVEYLEQHVYDLVLKIRDLAVDNFISLEFADEIFLNLNNNIDVWKSNGGELCENWKKQLL